MSRNSRENGFRRTALAAALVAAFGATGAWAQEDIADLTKPSSSVSVGAAGVSGDSRDRSLFGQYNGLRDHDAYFLLDFDYVKRDDATGMWTIVKGRDLGLDTRELGVSIGRQGSWRFTGDYWELTRWYPRTINTSLEGAGTTTPIVSRLPVIGAGSDLDLKTERKRFNIGGQGWFGRHLNVEATFTNEEKEGARLWGRGFTCPSGSAPTPVCTALATGANQWALLMLPEPIDSSTRQFEAKLNFTGDRFALTAGYYGSFYVNHNGSLNPTVTGNLNNPLGNPMGVGGGVPLTAGLRNILQLPMALPPDNQSHQFSLAGNYAFSNATRGTFKLAYSRATQDESFGGTGLSGAPSGRDNLDGRLDTKFAQAGITSRLTPQLGIVANVRYDDKEDKTPIDLYNIEGTDRFTNSHISLKKVAGKLEANYRLPWSLKATAGVDYESIDRGEFVDTSAVAGLSGLRQKTYETSYRVQLRRAMSETVSGSVGYVHSDRDGSTWLKPGAEGVFPADPDCQSATVAGVPNACIFNRTGIFPTMLNDRKRDKWRFLGDWTPAERVSLQLALEHGKDKYAGPSQKGLRKTRMRLASLDAAFAMSEAWKLNAYYSYSEQTLLVAHSTGYIIDLKDRTSTAGIGVAGKATPKLQLGADLMFVNNRNVYAQELDSAASAANVAFLAQSGGIPDVTFRDTRLKVYGKYALQKNAEIRMDVVHDRAKLDEWSWGYNGVAFAYSDNTTLSLLPNQNVTYVSLIYTLRFR